VPSPPTLRSALALAALSTVLASAGRAAADDEPSTDVGGVTRPASFPGDDGRAVLDGLLFVPRSIVRIAVLASTATASFFENQQVIPRAESLLRSEDGTVRVTPTLSLASGLRPDVGARVTAKAGGFASMLRTSVIGPDSYVVESRLLQGLGNREQTQLVLEGYQERRISGYGGVGPVPSEDGRNAFQPGHAGGSAAFLQARQRIIAAIGTRVAEDYELLLSTSFQRRTIEDAPDEVDTVASTFLPGTVPGAYDRSERMYTEAAIRRDTRAVRGPPAAGLLLEAYGGSSQDTNGVYAPALHTGGRASWFISVVRKTSIINPRVTLDVVAPLGSKGLPFLEYAYASGFRGQSGRSDRVAALASVDYRWQLRPYVAARVFVDVTTVAPAIPQLSVEHLAWATGFGIDLHSSQTAIGRVGISFSPDAVQLLLVFGLADPGFGDRQHR
jgi:hypothetical protein